MKTKLLSFVACLVGFLFTVTPNAQAAPWWWDEFFKYPESGDPASYPHGFGPQGEQVRIYNYVRFVRGGLR